MAKKTTKKKTRAKTARRTRKPAAIPQPQGLTFDQKLDIAGVLLAVAGIVLILAFLSPTNSTITGPVLLALGQLFGLGRFLVPIGFLGLGAWIVVRHFGDRIPQVRPEQIVGFFLLYLALLTSLHFFLFPESLEATQEIAAAGNGGGFIGGFIMEALVQGLDWIAAGVALFAWLFIALLLAVGMSTQEFFALFGRLQSRFPRPTLSVERQLPLPMRQTEPLPPIEEAEIISTGPRVADEPVQAKGPRIKARKKAKPTPEPTPEITVPATTSPTYDRPIYIGGQQDWTIPEISDVLDSGGESAADDDFDRQRTHLIEDTLASFGAPGRVVEVNRGPVITQFGVEPEYITQRNGKRTKVKVNKIATLADDLALALAARSIRIEAPVPGKGFVGIEVPNTEINVVALRDVMESPAFQKIKSPLAIALGQDVSGQAVCADLAGMPHLLIAGTTGSGKSVCVNSIITALLLRNTPEDLKVLMVDPKRVELTNYNGIPHLLSPVVVDLERVVTSLKWIAREMDMRYTKFAEIGARNIRDFNQRATTAGGKKMPYLIVIIDELADLMMLAPDETEKTITRLAQMARATGIHVIIATQRPSVDVVTGLIKANFPARISFAVASSVDSRVILDAPGAERLLGRGDMLFQSPDAPQPLRMQGVFVSDIELQRIVQYWKGAFVDPAFEAGDESTPETPHIVAKTASEPKAVPLWEEMQDLVKDKNRDVLFDDAVAVVRQLHKASISLLQRRLRIGYTRSARLIDALEEANIVGPPKAGAQQRDVLDYGDSEFDSAAPDATPEHP